MKITQFSEKPYYPYLLSNGKDAVVINYCGAMMTGMTGHIHAERHQGTVCAWYKQEHRHKNFTISPVIIAGYLVVIDKEVCEVTGYEQEYECRSGMLKSRLNFRCGTTLLLDTYLTDSGVLAYELEVLETQAKELSVIFFVLEPNSYAGTFAPGCVTAQRTFAARDTGADFTYDFPYGNKGRGSVDTDRTDGKACENAGKIAPGVRFDNVKAGWKGTMFTRCADDGEALPEITADLKKKHVAAWQKYYGTSDIHLPDPELQYAYELGRYQMRAYQHPGGAITCGMLPHMWGGGLCCPFDAGIVWLAMLMHNNLAETRKYLQFFLDQYEQGEKLTSSLGVKGVAFSNWHSVLGEHLSADLKRELLKRKPVMIAIIGIAAGEYCLYADKNDEGAKKLLHGCADFIESGFIRDGKIASTVAGNESFLEVERDSFMLTVTIRVLELDARFNNEPRRFEIAQQMRAELELNRNELGIIADWKGAAYYSGMAMWNQYYVRLQNGEAVGRLSEICRTPWGFDGDQPNEVCRHWPWNAALLARAFARECMPQKAFPLLTQWLKYSAANGATPEKILLDGYEIGYWYPTPPAVYLQALAEAFARVEGDTLYLMQGFDGSWRDLSAENIRLEENCLLSIKVEHGKITHLEISGYKPAKIVLNPAYLMAPDVKY